MTEEQSFFGQKKSSIPMVYNDPAAVAAAESVKARIQAAYIMALQKPRSELDARDNILRACKRTEFAGKAEYSKPIGGKKITGPSIRFAELALREWGNMLSEVQTLFEDDDTKRIRVSVLDLETNAQFSRDLQLKKTIERKNKKGREDDVISERKNTYDQTVYILRATDEEMYVKESAWVSRVLRNEGLRIIPTDIIEEGMQQARATLSQKVYLDPEGEKKKLVDAFSSIGVKPKDLERFVNHSLDTLSPAEIISLRTVYQSIRDGETTWSDYTAESPTGGEPLGNDDSTDGSVEKFNAMVKKETGKQYVYDDKSSDTLSLFIRKCAQGNNNMNPIELIKSIAKKPDQFPIFWNGYQQAVAKKTSQEKTTATTNDTAKTTEPPDPQTEEKKKENPYNTITWTSCKQGGESIIRFAKKNKEDLFIAAYPESQKGFHDIWHRRFETDGILELEFPFEFPVPSGKPDEDEQPDLENNNASTENGFLSPDDDDQEEGGDYNRTDELQAVKDQNPELWVAACSEIGFDAEEVPDLIDEQKILWDMIMGLKPQFLH